MSAAPRYRLDLCFSETAEAFRAWLASGSEAPFVYAKGARIDQQRDVAVLARQWASDGLVRLHNPRAANGEFLFTAIRLAAAREKAARESGPALPDKASPEGMVLDVLRRAANFDRPCPTNREIMRGVNAIAERVVLQTPDAAGYRMNRLAAMGLIEIEDRGSRVSRLVTVIGPGGTRKTTLKARTPVAGGAVGA